jgi:hypothetical protein
VGSLQLRTLIVALVVGCAAFAQSPEDRVRGQITGVAYAVLAEHARVQGDVHLHLHSDVATVLSGSPLLARTAIESAKTWGSIPGETNFDVTYHFVLVNITMTPTSTIVPRGNAFERVVLRILRRKTDKAVSSFQCQQGTPPPNDLKMTGPVIEVWIYGGARCVVPEMAVFVAQG